MYDSLNQPNWYIDREGRVVLSGAPCPIQTVGHLLYKLKLIMKQDLPSQDLTFKRVVHENTDVYMTTAVDNNGLYKLSIEPITHSMIKSWQNHSTDHMTVDVVIGGPSYILTSDKVRVLVNKPYYNALGVNGKRKYLDELLTVHGFMWQDKNGQIQHVNKQAFDNLCSCDDDKPTLQINNNVGGFDNVDLSKRKGNKC